MKNVQEILFHAGSKEELLPGFRADFPYIASRVIFDENNRQSVPWHWHRPVELFYIESGALFYDTPSGKIRFPAGSGGLVSPNVLHTTQAQPKKTIQLLHIFDTALIAGDPGSLIQEKYITPLVTDAALELLPLFPENPKQKRILERIRETFYLSDHEFGYEIRLREALSGIWLELIKQIPVAPAVCRTKNNSNDKIKSMMVYIHEHYAEKITVPQLAAAAYLSERECFRVFHDCLHMTPVEYIKSYRLQAACRMLAQGKEPVTAVSHACGLGNHSYFGKIFRDYAHCTPSEYRKKWQNRDTNRQKWNSHP